jgi:hypothetical protein
MWMTVLAMKTMTAENRIGSQSDAMVIIGLPFGTPRVSPDSTGKAGCG